VDSAAQSIVRALYPDVVPKADYSSIVNARHYARLIALVEDARGKGARIVALGDAAGDSGYPRRLAPTLGVGVTDDMAIMREEIFGPLLPVEAYASLEEAIAKINARP